MTEKSLAAKQEDALAELDDPLFMGALPEKILESQPLQKIDGSKPMIIAGGDVVGIIPRDIQEAWSLSQAFVRAGMVPDSYEGRTPEESTAKIMIGILKGLEVGLAPVSAISTIMIINKRPSIWGDGAIALVQRTGKMEIFRETLTGEEFKDNWTAICEVKRIGQEITQRSFTWGNALKAGLTNKGPWKQYPQRMLQMRARAWALRDIFSDCLHGLAIAEEIKDFEIADRKLTDTSSLEDAE